MKKYVKSFFHRGLIFGGIGPIVTGITYLSISLALDIEFSGIEVIVAILSTYLIAFIHAGSSIFNQIEEWSILKSTTIHFITLYLTYIIFYIVNSWIPFSWIVILIFTLSFIFIYLIIWFIVFTIIKITTREMNKKIV